jgi:hypothetical protein
MEKLEKKTKRFDDEIRQLMAQKKFNHAKAKISGNEFQLIRKR